MKPIKFSNMVIAILALWGAWIAFDQRFFHWMEFIDRPVQGLFLYFPTLLFALLALFKWQQGRRWSPAAFTVGLFITGLFHQMVIGQSHNNPGYMFPVGHILAPFVSLVAYTVSFILVWWFARNPRHDGDRG